jgi:hypothetical protein
MTICSTIIVIIEIIYSMKWNKPSYACVEMELYNTFEDYLFVKISTSSLRYEI